VQRKENNQSNHGEMGFFSWLTIIFVIAKILGLINWPWLGVFSPFIFIITLSIATILLDGWLDSHDS